MPDNQLPRSQPTPHHIDVDAVIRRARRRRVPSKVGVALVSTLAVVGLFGGGIFGLAHLAVSSSGSASSAGSAINPQTEHAPVATGTLPATCGMPAPALTPSPNGLVASAKLVSTTGRPLHAVITLTNTGPATIHGEAAVPIVVFARKGIVVNHSSIPADEQGEDVAVDLKPGTSKKFELTFSPALCHRGDDVDGEIAGELVALPAGSYQLYSEVQLSIGTTSTTITGPAAPVILH